VTTYDYTSGVNIGQIIPTGPACRRGTPRRRLANGRLGAEEVRFQSWQSLRRFCQFVKRFAALSLALCAIAVLLYGLLRGGWLDAVLSVIALSMSVLPEEFPALSAWTMRSFCSGMVFSAQ
jgi:P-type Ca2+ transporter type 2C